MGSTSYYPINISDGEIRDNTTNGIFVQSSRTHIDIRRTHGTSQIPIISNIGGYGIYMQGNSGGAVPTAGLRVDDVLIEHNGRSGRQFSGKIDWQMWWAEKQKVPCKRCGGAIMPYTAQKTGGFCMPCSKKKNFWRK